MTTQRRSKTISRPIATNTAPLIARIAATKAKLLLFALKGDGLDFIRQADDRGLLKDTTVAFLGLSEVDLGVFKGKGQNMFAVAPSVATSDDPAFKAFVAKVRSDAGPDATVSNYVMTHYNAVVALKAAIEKAGKDRRRLTVEDVATNRREQVLVGSTVTFDLD